MPNSLRPKTRQNESIVLMLDSYLCWFFDFWKIRKNREFNFFQDYEERGCKYSFELYIFFDMKKSWSKIRYKNLLTVKFQHWYKNSVKCFKIDKSSTFIDDLMLITLCLEKL